MTEIWLPVVGYEGLYAVSDLGRVRSLDRVVPRSDGRFQPVRGRIMKLQPHPRNNRAHLAVALSRDNKGRLVLVHRLVLEAFVGPCPPHQESCHWDDIGTNNMLSNLRWDTPSNNRHDRARNGKHPNASRTRCANGHEFTPENTYYRPNESGSRTCRERHRIQSRGYMRAKRKTANTRRTNRKGSK